MTTVEAADAGTFDAVLLLYIACAKLPDGRLDEREAARILQLVHAHTQGLAAGYAEQAVEDVARTLGRAPDVDAQLALVVEAAERLKRNLDDDVKANLVGELRSIARADGSNEVSELQFVNAVAKTLGVA